MKKEIAIIWMIIALIVWFYSGTEYTKYKIRSAFTEGISALWETFNSDLEKDEKEEMQEPIIKKVIALWNIHTMSWANNQWELNVKIYWVENRWKEYSPSDWNTFSANNNVSSVIIETENVWKKEAFLWTYWIKLITSDGYEFSPMDTNQLNQDQRPDSYEWCVSCGNNPWVKAVEEFLFDIDFEQIEWATLILDEDSEVEFAL